jgi:competence protein ComEA
LKRPFSLLTAVLLALLVLVLPGGRPLAAPARYASAAKAEKIELLDLNSASKPALLKLPAVGDAIADRIIAGRPWKSKYDLVVKKVVTRSAYDRFSKYVVARQADTK